MVGVVGSGQKGLWDFGWLGLLFEKDFPWLERIEVYWGLMIDLFEVVVKYRFPEFEYWELVELLFDLEERLLSVRTDLL